MRSKTSTVQGMKLGTQIECINNSSRSISHHGEDGKAFADSLSALTEAIIVSQSLPSPEKKDALERVQFIAGEAEKPPGKRNGTMVRTALLSLPSALKSVATLAELWSKYEPAIAAYFGF